MRLLRPSPATYQGRSQSGGGESTAKAEAYPSLWGDGGAVRGWGVEEGAGQLRAGKWFLTPYSLLLGQQDKM